MAAETPQRRHRYRERQRSMESLRPGVQTAPAAAENVNTNSTERLSPSEVESLRSEMQRSSEWMRRELQKG